MTDRIAAVANLRIRVSSVDAVVRISVGTRIYLRSGVSFTVNLPLEYVLSEIWPEPVSYP